MVLAVADGARAEAVGPTFSCDAPRDPLFQVICMDRELSLQDLRMAQAFHPLRGPSADQNEAALIRQWNGFRAALRAACRLPASGAATFPMLQNARACPMAEMEAQRGRYLSRLSGPALQEASRPIDQHVELQERLLALGFLPARTVADGEYGPVTRTAIQAWQRAAGRPVTGFIGDGDATALLGAVQPRPAPMAPVPVAPAPYATAPVPLTPAPFPRAPIISAPDPVKRSAPPPPLKDQTAAQPPTAQPPTAQPPTAQPPTAQPPTAQPPTAQPPTSSEPAPLPSLLPPMPSAPSFDPPRGSGKMRGSG